MEPKQGRHKLLTGFLCSTRGTGLAAGSDGLETSRTGRKAGHQRHTKKGYGQGQTFKYRLRRTSVVGKKPERRGQCNEKGYQK
jgi:hypothetical protein